MRTIVPAPKRINPWRVARIGGLSLASVATIAGYIALWHYAVTSGGFQTNEWGWPMVTAIAAFLTGLVLGIAAIVAAMIFCATVLPDWWDDLTYWWRERESAWERVDDR